MQSRDIRDELPDLDADQRLVHLLRTKFIKLRWIGREREAEKLARAVNTAYREAMAHDAGDLTARPH